MIRQIMIIIETALATFLFTKAGEFLFYYLKKNRDSAYNQSNDNACDRPEQRAFVPDGRFTLPVIISLFANGITILFALIVLLT